MKFSEEYKSAMNEISPDEQTSRRIENAVMERISVPEKKKKPFYVYAGALSGAAACIAVLCVVLINVNSGGLENNSGGIALAPSSNYANKAEASVADTAESAPTDTTNVVAESSDAPTENAKDIVNEYQSAAGSSGLEAPTTPAASDSENRSSQPQDTAVREYTITFLPGGAVVLEGDNFHAEFRSNSTVTRFVKPQQDLSRAKTVDGELYRIRLESNYLYIFEDDLQTAECYKLV